MLYNINRDTKKDPQGWSWLHVFPEHREERAQTEEEMFQAMMIWTLRQPTVAN